VVETSTAAAAIQAADAGLKSAHVQLVEVRLADGLGGKGIVFFSGELADVEIAVANGVGILDHPDMIVQKVVIPRLHAEMWDNVSAATPFSQRVAATE
ncbi:MAG: BMC domain-containing protein, partial [Gemmatimonadales bacterium]